MVILSAIFHISFVSDKIALIEHYGGGYFGYGLSYLIVNTFWLLGQLGDFYRSFYYWINYCFIWLG